MTDLRIRTEDLRPEEILSLYVAPSLDRQVVDALKGTKPVVLEGSRGTGKSFLLRVAELQLDAEFDSAGVLPVYVSFARSSLIHTDDPKQFTHWMLARICERIHRALYRRGLLACDPPGVSILGGRGDAERTEPRSALAVVAEQYERSYQGDGCAVDPALVPDVDRFGDAVQDLCDAVSLQRIALFFDEAAHVFRPEQQREFFTLFRDLRSPFITCNAAVYPGVTAYGPVFQPAHDAEFIPLNRSILDKHYLQNMREIVAKQGDDELREAINRNGENFDALATAVSGNPRLLLKTIIRAPRLNSRDVNEAIKAFYRTDIWAEHSALADMYPGYRGIVDWGRRFIDDVVIPDTSRKNREWLTQERKESTCFFWVHRDSPEPVKEALRLLAYTGIVVRDQDGIKATRSEIGTRYSLNVGCLVADDATPVTAITELRRHLTPKRFTEYSASTPSFLELQIGIQAIPEVDLLDIVRRQLAQSVDVLDITEYQKNGLHEIGVETVAQAFHSTEETFQQIPWVGPKRSRRMMNAVCAAVLEYLSG